jgi:CheY-like chemotaxis protein
VDAYTNGEVTLVFLRLCTDPCVVILDYYLPGLNGLACLRSLLQEPALARHRVVFTTCDSAGIAQDIYDEAAQSHIPILSKPFEIADILNEIKVLATPQCVSPSSRWSKFPDMFTLSHSG